MSELSVERSGDFDDEKGFWGRIELIAAILLGLAGVLTAYAAFQGALEDGDALDKYTESATLTADANGYYNDAKQNESQDLSLFTQWAILQQSGQEDTAELIKQFLFSEPLLVAFDAWIVIPEEESPPTPLDMEEYVLEDFAIGDELTEEAETAFAEAQKANDDGDKFELASVFLAVALFAAGIASLFRQRSIQVAMLIGSVVLILPGLWAIADGKGWI